MLKIEAYNQLKNECDNNSVNLIAVSKRKSMDSILELHRIGQVDFGENRVQELKEKAEELPGSIKWHFIGHLQRNKVKYIAPYVYMIHGIDSIKLLTAVNKEAIKFGRIIDVLLQFHIAEELSKFGFVQSDVELLKDINIQQEFQGVRVRGVMGMATNTLNKDQIRSEFIQLRTYFDILKSKCFREDSFDTLSMGMSGDYVIAMEEGSTMIRVGSLIFGPRD